MADAPTPEELCAREFGTLEALIAAQARARPSAPALVQDEEVVTYAELDARMNRIGAALQRDGVGRGGVAAICGATSLPYATAWLGVLRSGAAVAPLAPGSTPESLVGMLADCGAGVVFLDAAAWATLRPFADRIAARRVALDGSDGGEPLERWMAPEGARPAASPIGPDDPFNIIYSSGTTGAPKGIVQPHAMRWGQVTRGAYDADSVTLISTPLYSNTTLVSFLPTLGAGGTAVLMAKFDAAGFLRAAARWRVTHAMLVPVQYARILALPDFDAHDLSAFRMKFSTSAPFAPEVKADVLKRWPGGLTEFYGMTEGGGVCYLQAHLHPDKLHTVGKPMPGHDIRLIDDEGREVAQGELGEVVGRSGAMMSGYHNRPDQTAQARWISPEGLAYIRTGDIGRFDADGFLQLMDRKKDMVISGGFNIYPSDLEAELNAHPAVQESAVFGVPSARWGETPVACVVLRPGEEATGETLKAFANARLGKTQRLTDVRVVDALPRSAIGKVLKRELRQAYAAADA